MVAPIKMAAWKKFVSILSFMLKIGENIISCSNYVKNHMNHNFYNRNPIVEVILIGYLMLKKVQIGKCHAW